MLHTGFTALDEVHDYRDVLSFDWKRLSDFVGLMQERDIRIIGRGLWYISNAHTKADIDRAIANAGEVLQEMPRQ